MNYVITVLLTVISGVLVFIVKNLITMNQNLQNLNATIPAYSKVAAIEIRKDEFAKTPKKSIKRYLYQEE